ncbi:theronine dehydrogenase [Salmonella enterica]|nr:theronine dehydrogenase [Salmonella enterica]
MKWRYSLRWKLPGTPCPGPQELVSEVVEAGQQAPESVMSKWVAGAGYAIRQRQNRHQRIFRKMGKKQRAAFSRNRILRRNEMARSGT